MTMSPEERKIYNAKYYTENKININEKLLAKSNVIYVTNVLVRSI